MKLKKSGFDGIIISGKSYKPVYLWIHEGKVEFRDANHLFFWGGDNTYDVDKILKIETEKRASTAVIGPAGEKKIKISCIIHDGNHSRVAGRCGGGAVMGSKNLKAIVVYGTQPISVCKSEKLKNCLKELLPHIKEITKGLSEFGTAGGILNYEKLGNFPHQNWRLSDWEEWAKKISGQEMAKSILKRRSSCRDCPVGCGRVIEVSEGPFAPVEGAGPEYESIAALGSNCLVDNLEAISKANELCNRYGLDTMSTGGVIGFAMEAYEKGLVNLKDTGGIELKWGDSEALIKMIKKIAQKEDIGNILGEGVKKSALEIGRNSIEFAIHTKGLEPSYHETRVVF